MMPLHLHHGFSECVDYPVVPDRLRRLREQIGTFRRHGTTINVLDMGCGTGIISLPRGMIEGSPVRPDNRRALDMRKYPAS